LYLARSYRADKEASISPVAKLLKGIFILYPQFWL